MPSRDDLLATLHVRDQAGGWTRGGDAALRIAAAVPILAPLAVLGRVPGAPRVADAAYRLVARNRGPLSRLLRLDACAPELRGTEPWAPPLVKRRPGPR